MNIIAIKIVKVHDMRARKSRKCASCGKKRLCTMHTVRPDLPHSVPYVLWFCNPCMMETPNWH